MYDAGKDTTRVKLMVCLLVVIGLVILVLHGKFSTYLDFIFSLCVCIKTFDCLMLLVCRSSFKGFNGGVFYHLSNGQKSKGTLLFFSIT